MTKKSQELKKQILANLTDWCFDPLGELVKSDLLKDKVYRDENHFWFRLYQDDETNPNWRTEPRYDYLALNDEDYQEIKESMIAEIKQSPQDWRIDDEGKFKVIKHKLGRKHWKGDYSEAEGFRKGFRKGFRDEEWGEIENYLRSKKKKNISQNPTSNQQAQQEQPPKEIWYKNFLYRRVDNNKY